MERCIICGKEMKKDKELEKEVIRWKCQNKKCSIDWLNLRRKEVLGCGIKR